MPFTTGQVIHTRYRIVKLLGQGGMGAVYRAWDLTFNRPVALKEMLPDPYMPPVQLAQLREQFRREAQVLATLTHPNLPRVTDFFEWHGNDYLVMDFIEGQSLADILAQHGPLPEKQVMAWAGQLLDALHACHQRNILHRDIKPQNIIICPDGRAVLVDFGLVKLWDPHKPQTQQIIQQMGTREYSPPEQFGLRKDLHTEPRSDIYSLGATLYHALVGREPPSAIERLTQQMYLAPPTQFGVPMQAHVESALLQALALEPQQRFHDANTMRMALFGAGYPQGAGDPRGAGLPQPSWQMDYGKTMPGQQERPQENFRRSSGTMWCLEMGTAMAMAVAEAMVIQILLWGETPLVQFVKLGLGAMTMGAAGWFIGDTIYQAITQSPDAPAASSQHRPTQKLVLSTRKLMRKLSPGQQIGLLVVIVGAAAMGAWFLGPLAYKVTWFWIYVPSYALVGPLVYAAVGRRTGRAAVANALVILIGGPVLKASVGVGGDFVEYLPGAVLSSLIMEGIAFLSEKTLLKSSA